MEERLARAVGVVSALARRIAGVAMDLVRHLFLIAVTVLVMVFRRKRYLPPVGWFWFLGTLVPVIGLVQVGEYAMADRSRLRLADRNLPRWWRGALPLSCAG